MNAETIAKALDGRKAGNQWMARCPTHDDRKASLSIRDADDGKVLVRCHANCDQSLLIAKLQSLGLWKGCRRRQRCSNGKRRDARDRTDPIAAKRTAVALSIWRDGRAPTGTLVETYLAWRGLLLPLPSTLRYHPGLQHSSGGNWPTMIALVTRGSDEMPLAIHRTFLDRGGRGKARVDPSKMMLGPCSGGAVRLAATSDVLMVGEGIETCLAAMQETGHSAWAALSTSGLRSLELPTEVRDVIVLADGDDAGEAAARDCARRWKREGRRVRIARAPRGSDFNDLLMGFAPCPEGAE